MKFTSFMFDNATLIDTNSFHCENIVIIKKKYEFFKTQHLYQCLKLWFRLIKNKLNNFVNHNQLIKFIYIHHKSIICPGITLVNKILYFNWSYTFNYYQKTRGMQKYDKYLNKVWKNPSGFTSYGQVCQSQLGCILVRI